MKQIVAGLTIQAQLAILKIVAGLTIHAEFAILKIVEEWTGGEGMAGKGGEGGKEGAAGSTYVRVTGSTRWVDELEKMGRLAKTGKGEGGAGK